MNGSFIEENRAASSAAPDPSTDMKVREELAKEWERQSVCWRGGRPQVSDVSHKCICITVLGFFISFFWGGGVHQPDVWHICIIRLKWHMWVGRMSFELAHCLPLSVRRFTSWLQTRLQLGSGGLSLAVGVKKRTRDLSGGVPLCFRGTESKLGWEAEVGSLWSAHRQHERSHLPFCSLVYR